MENLKIAAAYIRVSTHDQEEYSPESQIKLIRDYAKNNGFILPEEFIFRDDGISGRRADKRPEFQRMISKAKETPAPFQVILVWKYSRFARNQEESIVYKALLKKENKIDVVSISEPLVEGPFGSLIERIIEWTDEYYSIRLSGEVKRGMTEKASRGEPVSIPAFGYDIKNKQYIPNEKEAPFVQMIFDDFISGMGTREIAIKLNTMEVRTHRGNFFENRNIDYILNNPVYIGKIRWTPTGRMKRNYDLEDSMIVDGEHQPLISNETWEQAQALLKKRKKMYAKYARKSNPKKPFMLQGIVRCSNCGSTLCMGVSGSLQCHSYAHGQCNKSHSITLNKINTLVISALERDLESGDITLIKKSGSRENQQEFIKRQIQAEKIKLRRVKEAYENGVDTLEEYKSNKQKIMERLEELQAKQEPVQDLEKEKKEFCMKHKEAPAYLQNASISIEDKNHYIRTFIDHIVFNRASGTVDVIYYN